MKRDQPDAAVEARVRTDLIEVFRTRLVGEMGLVLLGHITLLVLVKVLLWDHSSGGPLEWWGGAVVLTTLARAIWQHNARNPHLSARAVVRGTRSLVLLQSLAWGVGALALVETMPIENLAIILIGFAGLTASATNTLAADRPSMLSLLGGMYVPVLIGILAGVIDRDHVVTGLLIVSFLPAMLFLHQRAHRTIVEQLNTTIALQDSEARLRRVTDSNIIGVAFWDASGEITDANDEYLRATDYTRDDLAAGRVNFRTLTPPEYAEKNTQVLEQLMAGEAVAPWEMELIRKDGTRLPVVIGVAPMKERRDRGVVFLLDITKRRQAEAQARWKAALLEAQVGVSADGILIVDAQGKVILRNRRLAELWSIPSALDGNDNDAELLQYVMNRARHPEQFLEGVAHLYAHPEQTSRDEIELVDGTVLDRYSAPVLERDGIHYGRIWSFHDVTEHKRVAEAMREARDLAERAGQMRSMFLANMSHEIRTPMNAVLGLSEILLDTPLSAEQRPTLELVHASAESLLGILNDILDYSKIEADRLELESIPFDLPRMVHATASLLATRAREKDLELIPDVEVDVPTNVRGDPGRLRQVLTNLIGNAVKFTNAGEVVVSVQRASLDDGRAAVRFSVRDTGIGIAADRLSQIFEEFTQADGSTTRQYGGTGLGLTIAQRLVRLMGGRITVTSEPGRGSEFSFTIPLPVETTPAVLPGNAPVALAGRPVLVVDDNATNRRIIHEMFSAEGARVDEAKDAGQALAALRAAQAAGAPVALAVIDVRMPGPDGFELAAAIGRDASIAQTPLLMLTSSGQPGDAVRCREVGVSGYLTKPVSRSDLLEVVTKILGGAAGDGPARALITRHTLTEVRRPLRILLAEDNPVNQAVAATMLRKRGHHVDTAANGRIAVAAAQASRYDLLLMDIQMPELNGFEATAAIRALGEAGQLPIVALTAHALSGERERCLSQGMDGYLAKPFKAHELFAIVEGWGIGASRPEAAALPANATPAVDVESLRGQLREAEAEEALDGILDAFLDCTPKRVETLRQALISGTAHEVAQAAHSLKSSAGAIVALPLARLMADIEAAATAGTLTDRQELSARLQTIAGAVLTDLTTYRREAVA